MPELMLSASTACFAGHSLDAALRLAAEMGFKAVELTLWGEAFHSQGDLPGLWWRDADAAERRQLRDALEPFAVVDGHLPFVDCRLVSANKFVEALCRELIAEALDALAELGGQTAVFHVAPFPARSHDELWVRLADACRWLGDRADAAGVRVALETGYPVGDEFPRFLDSVDPGAVGACLDVGHLTAAVGREARNTDHGAHAYNDYLMRLVEQLGPRLRHLHVHDVRYDDWRDHREVGTGILDFAELLDCLRAGGFAGRLTLELEEADPLGALERSKQRLDALLGVAGEKT